MRTPPWWAFPVGTAAIVAAIFTAVIVLNPPKLPKFAVGSMVETIVGQHRGQVVHVGCNESACFYDVRFDGLQFRTDTKLLGQDGPVKLAPVSRVNNMREFELREAR
jgi:hypothetical protein